MSATPIAAPRSRSAKLPRRRPNLSVVPVEPSGSQPLEPRAHLRLHPKGCRCAIHDYRRTYSFADSHKNALALRGPRIFLWDFENWYGNPAVDAYLMAQMFQFTKTVLGITRNDYIVGAMSHFTAQRCAFTLPLNQMALLLRSGPNGADDALIEAADLTKLSKHFKTLVVISNDNRFIALAKQARGLGMTAWNVSSDLSDIADQTRAAYQGHTHLKLSTLLTRIKSAEQERTARRNATRKPAA